MKADAFLQYLDQQMVAIRDVVEQLDEVQVRFNARFDSFKARHDALLDRLTGQIADDLDGVSRDVRDAIVARQPEETKRIEDRRTALRDEYLPRRQDAVDQLLAKAQSEMADLRTLNPELDRQEEELKLQKTQFEAQLQAQNDEMRRLSRGFGFALHFVAITRADRERQRLIGKLETINDELRRVRLGWQQEKARRAAEQARLKKEWQLESIAAARLQAELDQLDDEARRDGLALRRATRYVVDSLTVHSACPDTDLDAGLKEMVELNLQTDAFHEGLASVGGIIGLLRGIHGGLEAVSRSVQGLAEEQRMHSAYLQPLSYRLSDDVQAFHDQWRELGSMFADEQTIGEHPADFSRAVTPLLEGQLSQARIESMFEELGLSIAEATSVW